MQIRKLFNLNNLPEISSLFVLLLSGTLFLIWIFFPGLKEFSSVSMKFNTSAGMLLSAFALLLLSKNSNKELGYFLAVLTLILGSMSLVEYVFDINFGIDQLFVTDFKTVESIMYPGRMSPIAAVCFILVGGSLCTINVPKKFSWLHWPTFFLLPVLIICLFAAVGYLYNVQSFYKIGHYIRIAWQSALCFFILALGILYARHENGPMAVITSKSLGGITARRLLPPILIIALVMGWVRIYGQQQGWVELELGTALRTLTSILLFVILIWITSKKLNAVDSERMEVINDLHLAIRSRDEFLSIASHELKTPLTSLSLQAQIVQRSMKLAGEEALPLEQVKKLVDQTNLQVGRLSKLVDDMLEITRIGGGKLRIDKEVFDLGEMVESVVERLLPQFQQAGYKKPDITNLGASVGHWDKSRIEQVLTNLLTNAIRYGQGRPILIMVEQLSETAKISITDHGIGIAPENQKIIFSRFERIASAIEISGLGLGLYITKEIVEKHSGKIWVESALGQGSTFIVELPLS